MSDFLSKFQDCALKLKCSNQRFSTKYFQLWGRECFFSPLIAWRLVMANADQELPPENSQIKDIERTEILLSSSYKVQRDSVTWLRSHRGSVAEPGKFFCTILFQCCQEKDAYRLTMVLLKKKKKDKTLQSFFQSISYCHFVCTVSWQILPPVFIVHGLLPIGIAKSNSCRFPRA